MAPVDLVHCVVVAESSAIVAKSSAVVAKSSAVVAESWAFCRFVSTGIDGYGNQYWRDDRTWVFKGTAGGEAICFSACEDQQTAADTSNFGRNVSTGAFAWAFIHAIESKQCRESSHPASVVYSPVHPSMHPCIHASICFRGAGCAALRLNANPPSIHLP